MNLGAPDRQDRFDRLFSAGRLVLLLALLILISYPGILLGTRAFFYRDAGLFGYPVAAYLHHCFWQGELPLWNPYNNCGTPFLAQWNTMTLYPGSLIYLLLPMPWSLNLFLLAHILLAGIGAYHLARRWFGTRFAGTVAGLAFAWNGLTLNCLTWPCHIAALAWMPWVILYASRASREGGRPFIWAALMSSCQMVTGSPEVVLFTWAIAFATLFVEGGEKGRSLIKVVLYFFLLGLLVTALSAAQLLPWLDLLAHGDRTSSSGGDAWALPPWGIANFLVPLFRSTSSLSGVFMQAEQQWTSSYYLGILPLLLALLAIWRRRDAHTILLAICACVGVLLAMGDSGGLLILVRHAVPLLGFTRYPVKFIILTVFSLSLLAGGGAAWLQRNPLAVNRSMAILGVVLGFCIVVIVAVAHSFPRIGELWAVVWPNGLERMLFLGAGATLWMAILKPGRALPAFGFLLLAGLDICTHVPLQNPTVPIAAYADESPFMTHLPRLGQSRAMLSPAAERTMGVLVNSDPLRLYMGQREELFGDCNLLNRIPKVGGFFGLHLAPMQKMLDWVVNANVSANLLDFLGVSEVASPRRLFIWEVRTNYMPMATIGPRPVFLDDSAALSALVSPEFSPRQIVYLPPGARKTIDAVADPEARILLSKVNPAQCVFETSSDRNTMLVMAQASYHCWTATVDGRPRALWKANYAFQAVEVPAGHHTVSFTYKDRLFELGSTISLAGLLFCVIGAVKMPE